MQIGHSIADISEACRQIVAANGYKECYLRPLVMRGYGSFGVDPFPCPIETYICTWQWGKYLGAEALEQGVDACVSSWTRIAPNTLPSMAKAGANYMNSQLIKMEAKINGYVEGIALDPQGYISEGSGENIFTIKDGTVMTPPLYSTILPGITRDSIIKICERLRILSSRGQFPAKCCTLRTRSSSLARPPRSRRFVRLIKWWSAPAGAVP
jgi:branched-chain amino acid aminotransferase